MEILVALIIIALLAAALYPTTAGRLRQGQATALATQLDALRQAAVAYQNDVRRFPAQLSQLTNALAPGALDACGATVPAGLRARWRGPYLNKNIAGNVTVGDATVLDTLQRQPANLSTTPVGQLRIIATAVDSVVAAVLERQYDAAFDYAAGTILWVAVTPPAGTLTFQIAIRGC